MAQLWLIIGIAIGAAGAWFALRARLANERSLTDSFKAIAADALSSNNRQFVDLAKAELSQHQVQAREDLEKRRLAVEQLVKPIGESLTKVDGKLQQLEEARRESQGALFANLKMVTQGQDELRRETADLKKALRSPHTRGRWGEIQLRRVCEMSGMLKHCDFTEQTSMESDDGRLRPDVIVNLPGDKRVVIDAKVPLAAYLDAIEAEDPDERQAHITSHVRQVRDHMKKLAAKAYWAQFDSTPEFVVMFVPEAMFAVALEENPGLIEEGVDQHVLIATPTTLIALLRAVHYGWRQETMQESAREVAALGRELHSRLGVMAEHFMRVGRSLGTSVKAYNEAVGSLESRVLVTARKLSDVGAASESKELPTAEPVDAMPRQIQAPELDAELSDDIKIRRLDAA